MPYATGDAVIVRNGSATWAGTVEAVHEYPDGTLRYVVRVSDFTIAYLGADMLAPAPPPKAKENENV